MHWLAALTCPVALFAGADEVVGCLALDEGRDVGEPVVDEMPRGPASVLLIPASNRKRMRYEGSTGHKGDAYFEEGLNSICAGGTPWTHVAAGHGRQDVCCAEAL